MSSDKTVRDLTRLLTQMDARIRALEQGARTGQLQNASITGTAITVYDEDGETRRGSIGIQPDGTLGFVAEGGPAPSALSTPVVTASLAGLRITWDGTFADGSAVPADFSHAAVHVSTAGGFTPSAATFAGTITLAGDGGMLPVVPLPYQTHYVVLVGVNTSGVAGPASAEASGTPLRVDGPDLKAGSVTAGAIAAGAVTADKLEAVLTVANRVVAGDPAGARVELNSGGLRVFDGADVEKVRFDSATGDAVFTGEVNGSTIVGSTFETTGAGSNVRILTDAGGSGVVQFPSDSLNENSPGGISSITVNKSAVNEFTTMNIDTPTMAPPANGALRLSFNSQNKDGSSNPNIQFAKVAGNVSLLAIDPAAIFQYLRQRSIMSSASAIAIDGYVSGDAFDRFFITGGGTFKWGDGTAVPDVALYRGFVDGTPQLETDSKFYAPTYGNVWASGSPLLTMASGWTLSSSIGIKVGGTVHINLAVTPTSNLVADSFGNISGDPAICTLVSGWRPNTRYGSTRLGFSCNDGVGAGSVLLQPSTGVVTFGTYSPSGTLNAGTDVLAITMSFAA